MAKPIFLNANLCPICTRSLSLDTTKLQEAIQSGDMEPVDALLRGMPDTQQKAQLCATYGGSNHPPDYLDKNHLDVRTSPMLHAARSGNSGAFSVLLRYTREMLKPQVGSSLVKKLPLPDEHMSSVLRVLKSQQKPGCNCLVIHKVLTGSGNSVRP